MATDSVRDIDDEQAFQIYKDAQRAEEQRTQAIRKELSNLIGGVDIEQQAWQKELDEYAAILSVFDVIRTGPTDTNENKRKLEELHQRRITIQTEFPSLSH